MSKKIKLPPDEAAYYLWIYRNVNPDRKPMDPDRLRDYRGFEHYTDEEAQEVIQYLGELATPDAGESIDKSNHTIDYQIVVDLVGNIEILLSLLKWQLNPAKPLKL